MTGQQIGLFSGPAFTLYKALTAVRVANWLTENGLNSVPVFWLATEDHDLAEVSSAVILNEAGERIEITQSGVRPAPQSPVGRVQLDESISAALSIIESSLPPGENRDSLVRDLRDCYQPGATWSEAFAKFMARLFGRFGVILADSLDGDLHQLSAGVYAKAIDEAAAIRSRLVERSSKLEAAGYHSQVHIGEDSTLLFQLREGNREALHQRGGKFSSQAGSEKSGEDLKAQFGSDPLTLSGNVLMRPILQDSLLPTLAYVAGPSELAYLGQAHAIYEQFGRPMPVIFPRAAFTLTDPKSQRLLEKYGLSVEDVWAGKDALGQKIASAGFSEGWDRRFDSAEIEIGRQLGALRKDIESLDPTLLDPLRTTEEKMKQQLEKLRAKLSRAALQRSDFLAKHQMGLLHHLYPEDGLQERNISGMHFLGRAGSGLLDRLLEAIPLESSAHQVLHI